MNFFEATCLVKIGLETENIAVYKVTEPTDDKRLRTGDSSLVNKLLKPLHFY